MVHQSICDTAHAFSHAAGVRFGTQWLVASYRLLVCLIAAIHCSPYVGSSLSGASESERGRLWFIGSSVVDSMNWAGEVMNFDGQAPCQVSSFGGPNAYCTWQYGSSVHAPSHSHIIIAHLARPSEHREPAGSAARPDSGVLPEERPRRKHQVQYRCIWPIDPALVPVTRLISRSTRRMCLRCNLAICSKGGTMQVAANPKHLSSVPRHTCFAAM
jgi:hypothetical protein